MGPNFAGDFTSHIVACGSVTTTGVAPIAGGTSLQMRGCPPSTGGAGQSINHTGGGVYVIDTGTFGSGDTYPDASKCEFRATVLGAAAADFTVHQVSWAANLLTIQTNVAAVATDCNFTFVITRLIP